MKNYDYSSNGAYFITICTRHRQNILGDITVGEGLRALPSSVSESSNGLRALPSVKLTNLGVEVEKAILFINSNYKDAVVDKYVIMPNHIHLIIIIHTDVPHMKVYDIVGRLKSFTTNECKQIIWQRSFFDHIIRDENDYKRICQYIETNPAKWLEDKLYEE